LKLPYWRVALEYFRRHETQAKGFIDSLAKMDEAQIEKMATTDFWSSGIGFVLGKSLVGGTMTGDIFEGVTPGAIPFARPQVTPGPAQPEVSAELAGPWAFYAEFRRAHGLTHLPHPEPPEIALQAGTVLVLPIWLRNQTAEAKEFAVSFALPAGWSAPGSVQKFVVGPKQIGAIRPEVNLPPLDESAKQKPERQEISVRVESGGQAVGTIKLRVEVRKRALPE